MKEYVKNEKTVSKTVDEMLNNKFFIHELFKIDAVNYSGLARYLLPEVRKSLGKENINPNAVIMAVKRFGDRAKDAEFSETIKKTISECSLFTINDLMGITLKKSKRLYDVILELQNEVDYIRGDVLYVRQSIGDIDIITERKIAKELLKKIDESDIIHKSPLLALIGVKKPEISSEVPGIIYSFAKVLAMQGIPIIDVTCTYMDLNFVVREEYASKAYSLLNGEIKKYRN